MKRVFMLEDDYNCHHVISWLGERCDGMKVVENLEDVAYFLEYEESYREYDKFIFDASLPGATVLHKGGEKCSYNEEFNGVDYMLKIFPQLGISLGSEKTVVLTAYASQLRAYLESNHAEYGIGIIDKNDVDLIQKLLVFLDA